MFYDVFCELCKTKGKSPNKAAEEIGLSNSITTKWKKTGATPVGETLHKVANYFGVSTDYLLGKEAKKAPDNGDKGDVLDDVDVAFYGTFRGLNEANKETIRAMARVLKEQQDKGN